MPVIGIESMETHTCLCYTLDYLTLDNDHPKESPQIEHVHPCHRAKSHWSYMDLVFNTLRPRPDGRHFADDIFKCIFFNENLWIPIKVSLKFISKSPINNIPALVLIMAWRRPGDKPLSEPMLVRSLTHLCIAQPQWVKHVLVYLQYYKLN